MIRKSPTCCLEITTRVRRWCVLGSLLLGCLSTEAAIPVTDSPVAHWNEMALDSIRATATPPPKASRILAMLHVAIHDAYNGVRGTYEQYQVPAPKWVEDVSGRAALAAAASDILGNAFPDRVALFQAEEARQLRWGRRAKGRRAGIRWGAYVAQAVIAARSNDGASTSVVHVPEVGPGEWVSTPPAFASGLLPQWGAVQPFGIASAQSFLPMPPPPLDGTVYAEEVEQVRVLGAAASFVRTPDQTQVARFWANGAGTATPPGHWNQIARQVLALRPMGLGEEARLMALLNVALADAAIVCWKAKYEYTLWRPITAIREADTDGNPLTIGEPGWAPLLNTPPFPEYTSGHSTFSGAGAAVLARAFGTDSIPFVGESDDVPGIQRPFAGFWHAAEESGMSRIYGGIHFMSANVNGLESGRAIALSVTGNLLRPVAACDGDEDDIPEGDEVD